MRLWDRLRSPWMRDREFSYYNRPHCVWPHLRQTAWEANHVVCGEPVADTLNLPGIRTMTSLLAGGKDIGQVMPNSAIAQLMVMPDLLQALTKGTPLAPVCAGHLDQFWGQISEALDTALPEDRERFNQWLKEQPTRQATRPVRAEALVGDGGGGDAMKIRLNGWQRLWIIVSFVYLLLVVGVTILFWPTPETTYHRDEFVARMPAELRTGVYRAYESKWKWEEAWKASTPPPLRADAQRQFVASFIPDSTPVQLPNGAVLDVRIAKRTDKNPDERVIDAYMTVVESATRAERWTRLWQMALVWLISCLALYASGWAIAWVRRGFAKA